MASSSVQTNYNEHSSDMNVLNAKILKPLDEVLRCHICFDYFSNCMITKCSHNYCSVCIRRYMTYKSQCPTCFQEATEPELQNNRLIDEILRIYKRIRENLQIPNESTSKTFPEQSTSSEAVIKEKPKKPAKAEASTHVENDQQNEGTSSDEVSCPVCYITVPNSRINIHLDTCLKQSEESKKRKKCSWKKCIFCGETSKDNPTRSFHSFPKDPERSDLWATHSKNSKVIQMSHDARYKSLRVCTNHFSKDDYHKGSVRLKQNAVPATREILVVVVVVNVVLELCNGQSPKLLKSQRKFLPKLVYHLLTEKEIKKKLKEHGLSTSGNRQALIRRHKNFIVLYNANCDSLNPKSVSDLILEIEQQELEEKCNAHERTTQVNKKSDPSVIEKEHESYVQEHKSQFNALIQEVQQRVFDERNIKTEIDTSEVSSNITDESGKVIGESTLRVGGIPESVTIKEEPPDSPLPENVVVKEEPPESMFEGKDDEILDPVTVKEELSESLLKDAYIMPDEEIFMTQTPILDHNISDKGMEHMDTDVSKTSHLPFRIKKDLPTTKIKDELLDTTAKQDFPSSNSSSLEDFEINKMVLNKYHKKKYARRLSNEEKNTQRKK